MGAMKPRSIAPFMRLVSLAIAVLLTWTVAGPRAFADEVRPFTQAEVMLLSEVAKGAAWGPDEFQKLFADPTVQKIPGTISDNVLEPIQLKHERYKHYTYPEAIERAVAFKKKWRTQFLSASRRYKVDENVILGILLVETNLGLFKGKKQLLSVFSSLYVDAHRLLNAEGAGDAAMKARLESKLAWAGEELQALLRMGKQRGFDLLKLQGSYAGAFGLAQFLPSSYMQWARNAYGGSRANLFWAPDAIHSVANYLKAHGYDKNAAKARNDKAIWHYNHSAVYVDTVRAVAGHISASQVASRQ